MKWKKLGNALLFPHIAVMICLIPISIILLVYSMVYLGSETVFAIISYVISAYTLTVWCVRILDFIRFCKNFKHNNKYFARWKNDTRLKIKVSLYGTLIWNTAYAVLQLGLGFWHHTFWFYSLAGYYIALAVMRFLLVRHTRIYEPGEHMREELKKYRACGIVFLLMNLTLSVMVFFMIYWNRTFHHHEITTIALAAYTFTSFTRAIINIVKYRKYNIPVYSASKAISLASACVSMLTLESTMLTTFGDSKMDDLTRKLFLGITGGVVSVVIVVMAVFMIIQSNRKLKEFKQEEV